MTRMFSLVRIFKFLMRLIGVPPDIFLLDKLCIGTISKYFRYGTEYIVVTKLAYYERNLNEWCA